MAQTMAASDDGYQFVSPIGYAKSSKCGYCGGRGQSMSYYANSSSLSPQFYKSLLDRCWRRSGKLLYRPNQRKSCCPHYTIRLDATSFRPSRDQRQTVNRFNKHVLGEAYLEEAARLFPKSKEEAKRRNNEFLLTTRIHEAEYEKLEVPPEPEQKLSVTLEDDKFTEEKYAVYDNYQKVVHKDKPADRTRTSFKRFLCSSPLRRQTATMSDGRKLRLGTYHQCYRLDGVLVAIGVLDLLPDCVSSVYFLYSESLQRFSPGKLGALYEISLALEGGYRWWYPGYYIHSCPKMRYKNDYSPQYILDPETFTWDPLDQIVLELLNLKPYLSLSGERARLRDSADGHRKATESVEATDNDTVEGDESCDDDIQSLFDANMPGLPAISEVDAESLGNMAIKVSGSPRLYKTSDLVGWETSGVSDWPCVKSRVAELVAVMGPASARSLCLDLGVGDE